MKSYQKLLTQVIARGVKSTDRTGVGTTSLFGAMWQHDMRQGFPLLTCKRVQLRHPFEELMWILSGSTNVKDLQDRNIHIWDEWATAEQCAKFGREAGDLGPVYGHAWRSFGGTVGTGFDQLGQLLDDLKRTPNSRRLIVSAWHPMEARNVTLPPCHTLFQLKASDNGELAMLVWCRSIDIFLGLPYDIAIYALLLTLLAEVSDRVATTLTMQIGDCHLYNNHHHQALELLSRTPRPLPTVDIVNLRGDNWLEQLLSAKWENVTVRGYDPHPKISAPVAV